MWTRHHRNRNIGRFIVPAVAAVFSAYFGYHAWHGAYGIDAKHALQARVQVLQAEYDAIKARREALERRVTLLHDGTIDRDMLDEQARRSLSMARAEEIVILREPPAR